MQRSVERDSGLMHRLEHLRNLSDTSPLLENSGCIVDDALEVVGTAPCPDLHGIRLQVAGGRRVLYTISIPLPPFSLLQGPIYAARFSFNRRPSFLRRL